MVTACGKAYKQYKQDFMMNVFTKTTTTTLLILYLKITKCLSLQVA